MLFKNHSSDKSNGNIIKNESFILTEIPNNDQFQNSHYDLFENDTSPNSLSIQIQKGVDQTIKDCPDVDWNEDFLTRLVIQKIRSILATYKIPNVDLKSEIFKFDIEAYKLTGNAEEKFGDVAFVVTRLSPYTKCLVTGVGFYEAKAADLHNNQYLAFDIQQLRRLVTNTPKLSYLLYDKEPHFSNNQEWPFSNNPENNFNNYLNYRNNLKYNVNVVDANYLKQCRNIGVALFEVGLSFGYHFVFKILSGRELDYSRNPIDTIKHWLKITRRANAHIVSISIHEEFLKPINTRLKISDSENFELEYFSGDKKLLD